MKKLYRLIVNKMDKFFIWIADGLGTNYCIFLFCLISFVPLIYQRPQSLLDWQQYISQTVIQLVALAILAKVAKIEGEKSNKIALETHDTVMKMLKEVHVLMKEIHSLLKKPHQKNNDLEANHARNTN